jgi:hypothetical protein
MADEYVAEILNVSKYEMVKDGGQWPIHWCPHCGNETFVEGVVDPFESSESNLHDRNPRYWVCFAEDRGWGYSEIDRCFRCGTPTDMGSDYGVPVCSDCFPGFDTGD